MMQGPQVKERILLKGLIFQMNYMKHHVQFAFRWFTWNIKALSGFVINIIILEKTHLCVTLFYVMVSEIFVETGL